MFKIGEFSKLMQVSIRMLRYYDEIGILPPAVVDPWTGHRFYSVKQIPRLNKILYLRDSGLNISEIAHAMTMDNQSLLMQLDQKHLEIELAIQANQEKLKKIELAKTGILKRKGDLHYQVSIRPIPAYRVLSLRRLVPNYYSEGELWNELSAFASAQNIEMTNHTFSIYHDTEYRETDVDIELCAIVKKTEKVKAPFHFRMTEAVPYMACTMVYGDFSNIRNAYAAFAQWLQENSAYQMSNPMRQIAYRGPWNEKTPENYLVELQIPLKRVQ